MEKEEQVEVVFDDPKKIEGYYVSFEDVDGRTKYVSCSEEFYHEYRNMNRELKRIETKDIYYKARYQDRGWVVTKEPPKYDDGHYDLEILGPKSIDYMATEYDYEEPDPEGEEKEKILLDLDRELFNERVEIALSDFNHEEKTIFRLSVYENKTDIEIARIVFKDESKRANVQRKKKEVYDAVVEFLKKFY